MLFTLVLVGCSGEAGETTTTSTVVTSTSAQAATTTTPPTTTTTVGITTTSTAQGEEVPSGLQVFGGPEVGFTLWVPAQWVAMSSEDFDPQALAGILGDSFDPAVVDMVEATFAGGGLLFAMDPVPTGQFFDNVNVIRAPASGFTAEGVANVLGAQMEQMANAEDVVAEVVDVPAGQAARVSYRLPDFGSEGVLYQIFTEDAEWVVTFSVADFDTFDHDVDELIASFQPVP